MCVCVCIRVCACISMYIFKPFVTSIFCRVSREATISHGPRVNPIPTSPPFRYLTKLHFAEACRRRDDPAEPPLSAKAQKL